MFNINPLSKYSFQTNSRLEPKHSFGVSFILLLLAALSLFSFQGVSAQTSSVSPIPDQLVGLWVAKKRFGPDVCGPLTVFRNASIYTAEMMGHRLPVRMEKGELAFELPNKQGTFRGKLERNKIRGHWFLPRVVWPTILQPDGLNRWRAEVNPPEDSFTFYLLLRKKPDGTLNAVLRNPEFDYGSQRSVDRLIPDGNKLKLMGKWRGEEMAVAEGSYDAETQVLTLYFQNRGGSYDFQRDTDESEFYPRGKNPARYSYHPPTRLTDGLLTGTLKEANIDQPALERFIQKLLVMPMDSTDAAQVHALLIARHGKLVFEEYFHGEHRDKLHNTRSASKSVTTIIVGAAMQAGAPLKLSSPVYQVMNNGRFPSDLEPQKRTMTLEHLLTMSAGYFCDDTNDEAPGNEDKMWDQGEEPDFYRYTLKVPLATAPGENAVYCSASPNLALGMVGRVTGEFPLYSFGRLVAAPLKK